jgi:DNA-binding transcriptional MerR regulator
MEQYTLNDLEKLTGIKADTIRMWEGRYGITKPHRTTTNRRWYTGDDLRKLINISVLKNGGIRISDIAVMALNELEKKAAALSKDNFDPDILTGSLLKAMTRYDETAVNEILLRSVIRNGFAKTFSSVVFPFLHRVGVLWHTGSINVGVEHFISNIFRQRLMVALENFTPAITADSRKILMFLPENEYHELGLLYYAYILRTLGHVILYLGQSTPLIAVTGAAESWNPDILLTGALSAIPFDDPGEYILQLTKLFSDKHIILSGFLADIAEMNGIRGVVSCRSEKELRILIKSAGMPKT